MKKWILAILSLTISSSAVASHTPFTGFYSGVNLGLIQSKFNSDYQTTIVNPAVTNLTIFVNPKLTDTAIMGGLTLGYSTIVNGTFVLGMEGRANFQNLNTISEEGNREMNSGFLAQTVASVRMDKDFSLLAKLGVAFNSEFLIYGLIGVDWGQVKISMDSNYRQNFGGDAGVVQHSNSNYESGLLLGLGIEYLITKCSTIGFEYNYINYGTLDFPRSLSAPLSTQVGSISANNVLKMQTNKVFVKFNFYFA